MRQGINIAHSQKFILKLINIRTMCGISLHTNKAHIIRSVLEAICYRTKDVIDAMEKDSNIKIHDLKVDGGPQPIN